MVSRKLLAVIGGVILGLFSNVAPILAHSGNIDSNGGHTCDVAVYGEKECAKWGSPPDYYHYHHRPPVTPTPDLFPVPPEGEVTTSSDPALNNRFYNGNFEFGFYGIPLGGSPHNWGWFMNEHAAGKYAMFDYDGLGIVCPDDFDPSPKGKRTLALQMNSTDQPEAWLGVYQVAHVKPGVDYIFSLKGAIQVAFGFKPSGDNHRVYIAFDQTGNTDWRAVPEKAWQRLPWQEQALDFTGAITVAEGGLPPLKIEDYYTAVTAQSKKLTVFIGARRAYPNIRSSRISLDCASLIPTDTVSPYPYADPLSNSSTQGVDVALNSETPRPTATLTTTQAKLVPMASSITVIEAATSPNGLPVTGQQEAFMPHAGDVLEQKSATWPLTVLGIGLLVCLFGAGWWHSQQADE